MMWYQALVPRYHLWPRPTVTNPSVPFGLQVPGKRVPGAGARTEGRGQPSNIRGGSRMQESCTYGTVRGAPSNGRPYRNRRDRLRFKAMSLIGRLVVRRIKGADQ